MRRAFLGAIAQKQKSILFALVYCCMLAILYKYDLIVHFGYTGLDWSPTIFHVSFSVLVVVLMAIMLPFKLETRSIFLLIACYMHFFPSMTFAAVSGREVHYILAVAFGGLLVFLFSFVPIKNIAVRPITWDMVLYISFAACSLILLLIILHTGVGNYNFDYYEIYYYRSDAKENLPAYIGYLRPLATKVFLPIFVILAFARRNHIMQIIAVAFILLYFGYTNHKSVIASTIVAVAIFYTFRFFRSIEILPKLFLIILSACMIQVFIVPLFIELREASFLTSMVVRRTLFVPALLDFYHIEYFRDFDFTYWSQSKISLGFIARVYDINTPFLIGAEYFGRETMAANTGFIGSGFSNAGYIGIAIYGVVIGLAISYLNSCGNRFGHALVTGVAFTQIIGAITSSDLPSVFLTNGLIAMILFFFFFPRRSL
ncbi:MAG: hypothetical protein AAGH68_04065 [Pseudomonadota bacterium]